VKTLKVLLLLTVVVSANVLAAEKKWVTKSNDWCRKHGFTPVCEVYEINVKPAKVDPDAARKLPASEPKADLKIFDRWGNLRTAAEPVEGDVRSSGFNKAPVKAGAGRGTGDRK
jgi:hypothetical protein